MGAASPALMAVRGSFYDESSFLHHRGSGFRHVVLLDLVRMGMAASGDRNGGRTGRGDCGRRVAGPAAERTEGCGGSGPLNLLGNIARKHAREIGLEWAWVLTKSRHANHRNFQIHSGRRNAGGIAVRFCAADWLQSSLHVVRHSVCVSWRDEMFVGRGDGEGS